MFLCIIFKFCNSYSFHSYQKSWCIFSITSKGEKEGKVTQMTLLRYFLERMIYFYLFWPFSWFTLVVLFFFVSLFFILAFSLFLCFLRWTNSLMCIQCPWTYKLPAFTFPVIGFHPFTLYWIHWGARKLNPGLHA